jgi:hypothetical protein
VNSDIRIVTFSALAPAEVPTDLQRYHHFADPVDFGDLVHWLTGVAPAPPLPAAATEWPDNRPALDWPVADHGPVRDAFGRLLTRSSPWRCLLVRGDSETGKSHLTRLMLGSALCVPGLACGRFDFKGTTGGELELHSFLMNLDVPTPAAGTLSARLAHILAELKQRAQPALLIFDTYEQAGEAQDWIEKQLFADASPRAFPPRRHRRAKGTQSKWRSLGRGCQANPPVDHPGAGGLVQIQPTAQGGSHSRFCPAGARVLQRQAQCPRRTSWPGDVAWTSPNNSGLCKPPKTTRRCLRSPR